MNILNSRFPRSLSITRGDAPSFALNEYDFGHRPSQSSMTSMRERSSIAPRDVDVFARSTSVISEEKNTREHGIADARSSISGRSTPLIAWSPLQPADDTSCSPVPLSVFPDASSTPASPLSPCCKSQSSHQAIKTHDAAPAQRSPVSPLPHLSRPEPTATEAFGNSGSNRQGSISLPRRLSWGAGEPRSPTSITPMEDCPTEGLPRFGHYHLTSRPNDRNLAPQDEPTESVPNDPELPFRCYLKPVLFKCWLPLFVFLLLAIANFASLATGIAPWFQVVYAAVSLCMPLVCVVVGASDSRNLLRTIAGLLPYVLMGDIPLYSNTTDEDPRVDSVKDSVLLAMQHADEVGYVALSALPRRLASLARSPEGYVVVDAEGIMQWCNDAFQNILGYELQELMGFSLCGLLAMRNDDADTLVLPALVGSERLVSVLTKGDSLMLSFMTVTDATFSGPEAPPRFLVRLRSTAEDDALVAQLRERRGEGPYQCVDDTTACALVVGGGGVVTHVSPAAAGLLRTSAEELRGRPLDTLLHAANADGRPSEATAQSLIGALETSKQQRAVAHAADDAMVPVILICHRLADSQGPSLLRFVECSGQPMSPWVSTGSSTRGPRGWATLRAALHLASPTMSKQASVRRSLSFAIPAVPRRCTIVMIDAFRDPSMPPAALGKAYAAFLQLVDGALALKGVPVAVVGDRATVTFNAAPPANLDHRHSAAQFMLQPKGDVADGLRLYMAAVCGEVRVAKWGLQSVFIGAPFDLAPCLLRAASEANVPHGVVDGELHGALQYNCTCRPINTIFLHSSPKRKESVAVYELLSYAQATAADEWLYEIASHTQSETVTPWATCWKLLNSATISYAQVVKVMQQHQLEHPDEPSARWLRSILHQRLDEPDYPPRIETQGRVKFSLRFQLHELDGEAQCYAQKLVVD